MSHFIEQTANALTFKSASEKHSNDMSEEDDEGCCKGFLCSVLVIASFKIETTSFTFFAILF